MTDRLAGKVALITGGASGLGANAALLMAQEGARVVVADIAADRGKAVAEKLGSSGHFVKLDVTSEENWQSAIAQTVEKFGAIHVLLNSAGIGLSKTVEDITLEEWRKVHVIDLDGVFLGEARRRRDQEAHPEARRLGDQHFVDLRHHRRRQHGGLQFGQGGRAASQQIGGAALRQVGLQHPLQLGASHLHRHADPRQVPRPLRPGRHAAEARPPGADWAVGPAGGSRLGAGVPGVRRVRAS